MEQFDAIIGEVALFVKSNILTGVDNDSIYFLVIGTIASFIMIFIISLGLLLMSCGGRTGKYILILGPNGVGKTVLFYKLRDNDFRRTVSSSKENIDSFTPATLGKELHFIDVPGAFIRHYKKWISDTQAIVFLVTSDAMQNAGEALYDILNDEKVCKLQIPLLILATKSDLTPVMRASNISTKLLNVINSKRKLQHNMASIDENANNTTKYMGSLEEDFKFENHPCPIKIGSLSCKAEQLEDIITFLENL